MDRSTAAILRHFDEHHGPLFRFAWRLTGSIADAEDIVQECFLALLRPGCAFDPQRNGLRTYLLGAVRNQALKRLQQPAASADTPEPLTPERECYAAELKQVVARAIRQLPEGQREVLLLAHYEQMPLAEIAEVLQIELGAVKSRLQRARANLRETLAAYGPNLERKP
ncbi:MAG: sigma-70 family RNA polymerase sigma factor [Acidobacteriia bacterium]|nr:sigma-70 family RNA polymerase sigma factor [Terriglobia bacterium]